MMFYPPAQHLLPRLYTDGDMQPSELPMHREISVISTVRLYFESPAAKRANQAKENEKGKD